MGTPSHTHFCWKCYGNGAGQGGVGGWWSCNKKPCVKGSECLCKYHRELEENHKG